jgi:hypothetical protein
MLLAFAAPLLAQEPPLQQVLDSYYGPGVVDVARHRIPDTLFKVVNDQSLTSVVIARFSLYNGSAFGWYNPNWTSEYRFIHPGYEVGISHTWSVPGKTYIGFALSLDQIRPTYYSEPNLNRNHEARCFALRHPLRMNTVIICWEDWQDWDFQDCVVEITGIETPPPDPGKNIKLRSLQPTPDPPGRAERIKR